MTFQDLKWALSTRPRNFTGLNFWGFQVANGTAFDGIFRKTGQPCEVYQFCENFVPKFLFHFIFSPGTFRLSAEKVAFQKIQQFSDHLSTTRKFRNFWLNGKHPVCPEKSAISSTKKHLAIPDSRLFTHNLRRSYPSEFKRYRRYQFIIISIEDSSIALSYLYSGL